MPIDPQDGGPDDWFVPASDGYPDDWFVPESDGYPDDWFVPASAAPTAAQPAPQPGSPNPALTTRPAPRPDPLADFWSRVPASRVGAMAWHPPIFLNSPGQSALAAPASLNASRIEPMRGPLGGLANLPWPNAPSYGLFGGLANSPSANQSDFPSFQPTVSAPANGAQPALPSLSSSLANLSWSPAATLPDAAGDTTPQTPFPDGVPFGASSNAQASFAPPILNSKPANTPASALLQTADQDSVDGGRSTPQPFRLNAPSLDQLAAPSQSTDETNSAGSSAAPPTDPDDSRSIIRVVRDATGNALAIIHVQPKASAPSSDSDATPDALRPGAKYAQINYAKTGNPFIDRTTEMLLDVLQQSIQETGWGWGPLFGTKVHSDFATRVRQLDLPGIGQDGVEQSYHIDFDDFVRYGLDGSIRTDITLRNPRDPNRDPIAVYDLKTGNAVLRSRRVNEILNALKRDVPVIVLRYRTGDAEFPADRAVPR
jgi:hypothetical protein